MIVRGLALFFGVTGGAASLWVAVDTFRTDDEPAWFAIAVLATVPALIGFSLVAPVFFAARTLMENTLVITRPVCRPAVVYDPSA